MDSAWDSSKGAVWWEHCVNYHTIEISSSESKSISSREREMLWNSQAGRQVFSQFFRVLPDLHECFFNSIETREHIFFHFF